MKSLNGLSAAVLLAFAGVANATPVTVNFTGTVQSVDSGLGSSVDAGDTITGSFKYDPATVASSGDATGAIFAALRGLTFNIGGLTESATGPNSIVTGHNSQDIFQVLADSLLNASTVFSGSSLNGNAADHFILNDGAAFGALFSDASKLPLSLNGAGSMGSFIELGFGAPGSSSMFFVEASLDSLKTAGTSVPEPATLGLLALGVGGLIAARRRKTQA